MIVDVMGYAFRISRENPNDIQHNSKGPGWCARPVCKGAIALDIGSFWSDTFKNLHDGIRVVIASAKQAEK